MNDKVSERTVITRSHDTFIQRLARMPEGSTPSSHSSRWTLSKVWIVSVLRLGVKNIVRHLFFISSWMSRSFDKFGSDPFIDEWDGQTLNSCGLDVVVTNVLIFISLTSSTIDRRIHPQWDNHSSKKNTDFLWDSCFLHQVLVLWWIPFLFGSEEVLVSISLLYFRWRSVCSLSTFGSWYNFKWVLTKQDPEVYFTESENHFPKECHPECHSR